MTNEEYEKMMVGSARTTNCDWHIDALRGIDLSDEQVDKLKDILHKALIKQIDRYNSIRIPATIIYSKQEQKEINKNMATALDNLANNVIHIKK